MTPSRPAAAPPPTPARPPAGASGATPSSGDPFRSAGGAPSRFDDFLGAAAPRKGAEGPRKGAEGPAAMHEGPGGAARQVADAAAERLVRGFAGDLSAEGPPSPDGGREQGEARSRAAPMPSRATMFIAGRPSGMAPAGPPSDPLPEAILGPIVEPSPRDVQLMTSLADLGAVGAVGAVGAGQVASAAAPRDRPGASERPLAHALQSTRPALGNAPPAGGELESSPLDVRTSRLAAAVSRIETHFAPVQSPVVTAGERKAEPGRVDAAGLFDQLRTVLDGGGERLTGDQRVATTAPQPPAPLTTAVRVLEIALQPASLGSLTVTFRLSGTGALKVVVSASERDTAAALSEEAGELAAIVAAAGYEVDDITVTYAARL